MTSMRCSSGASCIASCGDTEAAAGFGEGGTGEALRIGTGFSRRQINPCVRKSSCSSASSSFEKRFRGTRTRVPRRKNPEPESSFLESSSTISKKDRSGGNSSISPSFSPLILIFSSLISVPHLFPTAGCTRSRRNAASMILRPIGTADIEPKPPCSTMTATTTFGFI